MSSPSRPFARDLRCSPRACPRVVRRAALVALAALLSFAHGAGWMPGARAARAAERAPAPPAVPPSAEVSALGDFPDPFIVQDGSSYFALGTNGAGGHVQAAVSDDLVTFRKLPDALPSLPGWADRSPGSVWAPAVLARQDRWVLYYTIRDAASGFQCISRAASRSPAGPYQDDSPRPLVCQTSGEERLCGSIDASPFVDGDGRAYLLWKSDENSAACRTAPRIWSRPLTDDGLSLDGKAIALVQADAPWEERLIEGPSMIARDGRYFLFYSANLYDTESYAIGYAVCDGPSGPCTKKTNREPLVRTHGGAFGPGGQEFFQNPEGRWLMAYHAWTLPEGARSTTAARSLRIAPLEFVEGLPKVDDGTNAISAGPDSRAHREN